MEHDRTGTGIFRGSIVAGPVFVAMIWLLPPLIDGRTVPIGWWLLPGALLMVPAALPGTLLAVLPVMIGTRVMTWLGRVSIGFRHPAIWGMAGGAATASRLSWEGGDGIAAALTATGIVCALVARSGVRWAT